MLASIGRYFLLPFSKNRELIKKLTPILGFVPNRIRLYELAFIHKSASLILPDGELVNNERLEFLGDAILDAIIADYLFRQFPNKDEGFLTKMRSKMVKRKHLNLIAYRIGINKLIVTHTNPSNISKHLYGNAFEALVGAIYLDKGFRPAAKFIERIINRYVDMERLRKSESDYKSKLIEWAQKTKQEVFFDSHEEKTPGNAHIPQFVAYVRIIDRELGRGIGKSKKDAEQKASRIALEHLDEE